MRMNKERRRERREKRGKTDKRTGGDGTATSYRRWDGLA